MSAYHTSDATGLTALHLAIAIDDARIVQLLLAHPDIDANTEDETGMTPIEMATRRGKLETLEVVLMLTFEGKLFV